MRADKIPPKIIEEILSRINLVELVGKYIALNRHLKAFCLFHQEKTPSFSIHSSKIFWKCFGCGAKGNAISFIRRIENLNFTNAVKLLADQTGVSLPKSTRFQSYISRKLESKKKLLERWESGMYFLRKAEKEKINQFLEKRKKFPPKTNWDSWDSKDYLREQLLDLRCDLYDEKMEKIYEKMEDERRKIINE